MDEAQNEPVPQTAEQRQLAEQHKAQAARWQKRLKFFGGEQKQNHEKRWQRNREHVNGAVHDDGENGLVRVNLIASVVNTIQPNIYAKAPEVSVEPEERLNPGDYAQVRGFAKTLEMVLNRYAIRGTMLKQRGKEAVRSSLTCTTGWVKVIFQRDKREDPLVRNRINDTLDDVQRIERLLKETKDEGQCGEYQAKIAELRQLVSGLEQQVEVTVSEGLVIDNVLPEHVLILDKSVKTIDEYAQASAIAHGVYMTVAAYKAQFKCEPPKKATRFNLQEEDAGTDAKTREGIDPDDALVLVWEIWSKDDLTVYTLCAGAGEFCRPPYQPKTLGARWYPFFPLQLWRVHGMLFARTLVDNLIELVDEYNTRRTTAAEHRRKNMPVRLLNKASGITDQQITAINTRGATTDIIGIEADPDKPLANQLGSLPEIPYNPAMYDTGDILRDVEMVSGAQDASRGGVNQAKTATEAEIMAQGMQSRTGEQLDTIEDWLTEILSYCAQLLLQNLTPEQVQAKFGSDAVWPELSKKDLFEQVMVRIRAGSTSKPNKMRERDQWLQFMPQMQQAVMQISELRQAGNEELAQSLIKMLDETLRRFDERMSIKEFVPGEGEGEDGEEGGQASMMKAVRAQVEKLTQQAEEALNQQRAELEQKAQELTNRETKVAISEIQLKADQDVAKVRQQYDDAARRLQEERLAERMAAPVMPPAMPRAEAPEPGESEGPEMEAPSVTELAMESLIANQAQMAQAVDRLLAVTSAPRRTVLIKDPSGRPVESVSMPVEPNPIPEG